MGCFHHPRICCFRCSGSYGKRRRGRWGRGEGGQPVSPPSLSPPAKGCPRSTARTRRAGEGANKGRAQPVPAPLPARKTPGIPGWSLLQGTLNNPSESIAGMHGEGKPGQAGRLSPRWRWNPVPPCADRAGEASQPSGLGGALAV